MFLNSPVLFNWMSVVYHAKGNNEKAAEMWAGASLDLKGHGPIAVATPEKLADLRRLFEKSEVPDPPACPATK